MIKLIDLLQEESHGLWWHINNNRKKGKKPARKGSKAFNKAVAAGKEINALDEEEENMLIDPNPMDDVPSVKIHIDDDNTMHLELSSFWHDGSNGKISLLKDNPVLQELMMKAVQMESQKAFRRAVHSVLGIPYGLKENEHGDEIDPTITCRNCPHHWHESESEAFDLYVCHECGTDNSKYY